MISPRKEFRYAQLADTIEGLIRQGVWQPGEKVPSVRQLRAQHGVSLSTAFQAYYQLDNAVGAVLRRAPQQSLGYELTAGNEELRRLIA
ncbi:MAG TPA: GntR family transcriptional regulator [Hymenobacter sp.]|jgi:DNA-binding transcriptional regulator YhcF (GntR family)